MGFGADGAGAGAEVYLDPLDSLSRLWMCSGVMSASFRAWMTMCEFFRKDAIWDA